MYLLHFKLKSVKLQVVSQNAAAMNQRKVNTVNDDDDLVVTAVTQGNTVSDYDLKNRQFNSLVTEQFNQI